MDEYGTVISSYQLGDTCGEPTVTIDFSSCPGTPSTAPSLNPAIYVGPTPTTSPTNVLQLSISPFSSSPITSYPSQSSGPTVFVSPTYYPSSLTIKTPTTLPTNKPTQCDEPYEGYCDHGWCKGANGACTVGCMSSPTQKPSIQPL
eukprot:scaffold175296_cov104-Cyclotella_meneghiniana.AAC.2